MLLHQLPLELLGFALILAFQLISALSANSAPGTPNLHFNNIDKRNATNVRKICAPQSVCQRGPKYSFVEFVHQTRPNWGGALW